MSDFVVIAGQTVPILEGQAEETPERQGLSVRAVDGTLHSSYSSEARLWRLMTGLLLTAELETLRAAAALGAHVACEIDGEAVTCEVLLGRKSYVTVEGGDGRGLMRSVELTLREKGSTDLSPLITDDTEWVL